jgi:hypothetical protein
MLLHPRGDKDVLGPVVATDTAGEPVLLDGGKEEIQNRLGPIVVGGANAGDQS